MQELYMINRLDQCAKMLSELEEKIDSLNERLSEIESKMQPVYVMPDK